MTILDGLTILRGMTFLQIMQCYAFVIDLLFPLWCAWGFILSTEELLTCKRPKN